MRHRVSVHAANARTRRSRPIRTMEMKDEVEDIRLLVEDPEAFSVRGKSRAGTQYWNPVMASPSECLPRLPTDLVDGSDIRPEPDSAKSKIHTISQLLGIYSTTWYLFLRGPPASGQGEQEPKSK